MLEMQKQMEMCLHVRAHHFYLTAKLNCFSLRCQILSLMNIHEAYPSNCHTTYTDGDTVIDDQQGCDI